MAEPATPKPTAVIGSITWGMTRKRPGPVDYSMDASHAEIVVLIPEGVRFEEAVELAKAKVKQMLGPEPPIEQRMGPATPRASNPPAPHPNPPPAAPASFSPRTLNPPAGMGRGKECKYGCGTLIAWDNTNRVFLDVQTMQPHRCNGGGR